MKPLLVLIFAFFSVCSYSQEYEWGYRFTVGQRMRIGVESTTKNITEGDEIFTKEEIEISVVKVDANGNVTLQLREVKQRVIDTTISDPVLFNSTKVPSTSSTWLNGSEATIEMSRYGEYIKGEYHKPSANLLEMRALGVNNATTNSMTFGYRESEEKTLRSTLKAYIPLLLKSKTISQRNSWRDSSAVQKSTPKGSDKPPLFNISVREYTYIGDSTIMSTPCFKVLYLHTSEQQLGGGSSFTFKGDGFMYFRKSDGMLMFREVDGNSYYRNENVEVSFVRQKLLP